ncbi:MAG: hypothetical protein V3U92_15200 [Cellulophaga sp.]
MKNYYALALFLFSISFSYGQQRTTNVGIQSGDQGVNNSFFGFRAGRFVTKNNNSYFGTNAGFSDVEGILNCFYGSNSGRANIKGVNNASFGANSGRESLGNNNVYFGSDSGRLNIGNRNVFVGAKTGRNNAAGNGNVYIGFRAGFNALASNRLYIDNSDTEIPLIFGNFESNQLGINTNTIPAGMVLGVGGNAIIEGSLFTNGSVAIGTTEEDPGYSLTVKGKIHVQEVKVDLLGAIAPDYVFYKDYQLRTLEEVKSYIEINGHLPSIPSAQEMQKNGINLKEMNLSLLEKIEELTLYLIAQEKQIKEQKTANKQFENRLLKLELILLDK